MKELIASILSAAVARAHASGKLNSASVTVTIEAPKDPAHGDAASNVALTMARGEGKPPRAIATVIKDHLATPPEIAEVSIAGPGFINFRMAPEYWHGELRRAAADGASFVRPQIGHGKAVQVEFLSANPTGPLTVGHGRNAVLGDTLARLFEATGYRVTREYYFNDGGRQMKLLGESVRVRYLQELGREAELPEDGYQGEYIREIAKSLIERHRDSLAETTDLEVFRTAAVDAIIDRDSQDLRRARRALRQLHQRTRSDDAASRRDAQPRRCGARATAPARSPGRLRRRDLAARANRSACRRTPSWCARGRTASRPIARPISRIISTSSSAASTSIIDVFGADHIAEHQQVIAAVKALGYDVATIRAIIYQFVTLTRGRRKGQNVNAQGHLRHPR